MSEVLKGTEALGWQIEREKPWERERRSVLLTGNNGQQISAQVSPGPPEACLIQLEPR